MTKIGFIGLGHMGEPMAKNLLKASFELVVYDLSKTKLNIFQSLGAKTTDDHSLMSHKPDIVITMLPSGKEVRHIYENMIFPHIHPNVLLIDCSTIDVETSRSLSQMAEQKKIAMVDAPVSGGVAGAEAGTLTFMVGGSLKAFEQAKPILLKMGKTVIHVGGPGNGQAVKICNNMMLAIQMISVAEGFALAEKLQVPADALFEVASKASGQCWSLTQYCPEPGLVPTSPANKDFKPGFTTEMMLKDLKLSQQMAQNSGASTPLGAMATVLYTSYRNMVGGNDDFSSIIRFIKAKLPKEKA